MYCVLVYDISQDKDGRKVLPKVFKICKKYLHHIQNSVFEGDLSEAQLINLQIELQKILRMDIDSVIIFKSRNKRWLDKEFWGKEDNATSNIF
jgi:CRISPR-associated protein Cas2